MFGDGNMHMWFDGLVVYLTDILVPFMSCVFVVAVALKFLIYYTLRRNEWFVIEFEKRVSRYIFGDNPPETMSFFVAVKKMLERTYYELFEVRAIMKRRKPDMVTHWSDRVFLIREGVAFLVKDTQKQIKHLKFDGRDPKLLQISKNIFQRNPCFNKVLGLASADGLNDFLNVLPNLFVVGGIFGTFLGIMKGLPDLTAIDVSDVDKSKSVIDQFLIRTSFAMRASSIGIIYSVFTTLINTFLSPDKVFTRAVDRFESALDLLWNRSESNVLPQNIPNFDEHRDPIEALAEEAVNNLVGAKDSHGARESQNKKPPGNVKNVS